MDAPGSSVAAIGERAALRGFTLAGVRIFPAETAPDMVAAWEALPAHTGIVILTANALTALGSRTADVLSPLTVVLPS